MYRPALRYRVSKMAGRRASWFCGVALALWLGGPLGLAAPDRSSAAPRTAPVAPPTPRVGRAMGLLPAAGPPASAPTGGIPLVYHGGPVMRNVTLHAVFWAPPGYRFDPSPGGGVPGYVALQQQFLSDAAAASAQGGSIFSDLPQYGDGSGGGQATIHFDPGSDTVIDTHPYPARGRSCPSPSGTATCVTDDDLQAELDRIIGPDPAARGLENVWLIYLPPDVDTCIELGSCATSAYAGYHSLLDLGHGLTVYAAIPDPLVELTPPPGSDPEGNPEAESAINTAAHEVAEAITDPEGTGWMDPNGFEIGDKCETGPQQGPALGYAADGSPYNQLLNGHPYLIQELWSDARGGCVTASAASGQAPELARVALSQFSAQVSGTTERAAASTVRVVLIRAGQAVASARGRTRRGGAWGPLTLRDRAGRPHAVGDDRDLLEIVYGPARGAPAPDLISTADGGDPFTEAGYTGWFDLDHGAGVAPSGAGVDVVSVGPCAQTGVLELRAGALTPPSPVALCSNAADLAAVPAPHIGPGTTVTLSSLDNRAESAINPAGALIDLRVTLGEPGSLPAAQEPELPGGGGFPTCTAYLRVRTVSCGGLVPGGRYRLRRAGRTIATARANGGGRMTATRLSLIAGDALTLVNPAGRRLSTLHVARLRVAIIGSRTVLSGGTCQPGEYWGAPLARPPASSAVGSGIGGGGRICPLSGRAAGLPAGLIAQTDEFSGGETVVQVPQIRSTAPLPDETLYGAFIASAQSGLAGPHGATVAGGVPIALSIRPAGSARVLFHAADVDTARGVSVGALPAGTYTATWMLHDAAGDTRTLTTRFTEA
jgi:hypothetical protein